MCSTQKTLKSTLAICSTFIVCGLISSGCSKQESPLPQVSETTKADNTMSTNTDIQNWPTLTHAVKKDQAVEAQVEAWLAKMTLEQKVGQMTQAEITWVTPEEVKNLHLGSVLNGGGSFLHGKRHAHVDEWVAYMDGIYDASMDTSDGGLAIPVTYGIDAVHGNNKFGHATIFPHNIGLGATRNPTLMFEIGRISALEVLATGIDWTFAPTLAVTRDDRWGRTYESYSENPELVAELGKALVEGVQGIPNTDSFLSNEHVYATAKHWVGDGGTNKGVDQGDNIMTENDLIELQASAYFPTIESGVQSIMASHNAWMGDKLHGHKYLLTEVLKDRLGFDGFIIGDWNAHGNVKGCTVQSCPQAVNAGLDMFMVVEDYEGFINNTVRDVKDGIIPMSRIDDAVRRILRVKIRSGLFEKGRPSSRPYAGKRELMGSEAHREVARQAVRESLVLLKNNDQTLPINPKQHILVAGDGADSMAKQSGGWTISWQSTEITKDDFEGATTLLDGFKGTVADAGGTLEYSVDGQFEQKPDVAIVVFGESPYAEWYGDADTLAYKPYTSQEVDMLKALKAQDIPVVSVFLSGRPLWVNREINASDAFVAAWLPGSEGKAVADVLFSHSDGEVNHDFKGKLSFSWPKRASQVVLNVGDADYDPLFAYDFGLTYADNTELAMLDEQNDFVVESDGDAIVPILTRGLTAPWKMMFDIQGKPEFLSASRVQNDLVSIMEADFRAQGDAQEFHWTGTGPATIGISSPFHNEDVSAFVEHGILSFDIRTIDTPTGKILLNLACQKGYCGEIDISEHLPSPDKAEWKTIKVPLSCFANQGIEFDRLTVPFSLYSDAPNRVRVTNVFYSRELVDAAAISCQ